MQFLMRESFTRLLLFFGRRIHRPLSRRVIFAWLSTVAYVRVQIVHSCIVHSRIVHPCHMVPISPLLHCPLPQIQRSRCVPILKLFSCALWRWHGKVTNLKVCIFWNYVFALFGAPCGKAARSAQDSAICCGSILFYPLLPVCIAFYRRSIVFLVLVKARKSVRAYLI